MEKGKRHVHTSPKRRDTVLNRKGEEFKGSTVFRRIQKPDDRSAESIYFSTAVNWGPHSIENEKCLTVLAALNGGGINGQPFTKDSGFSQRALQTLVLSLKRVRKISSLKRSQFPDPLVLELDQINKFLGRFTAKPFLDIQHWGSQPWSLTWARPRSKSHPFLQINLLLWAIEMGESGRIDSLKQCRNCGRWLWAKPKHQQFCPRSNCRDHFHQTNDADKKRRREWKRANYQLHRKKNVK